MIYDNGHVPGGKKVVNSPELITLRRIEIISMRSNNEKGSNNCGAVTEAVDRTSPHRSFSASWRPPGIVELHAVKRNGNEIVKEE